MCLAVPVKVVELLDDQMAIGEQMGVQVGFSIALLESVSVGDYLLVHTGIAIERLDEAEAQETLRVWSQLNGGGA